MAAAMGSFRLDVEAVEAARDRAAALAGVAEALVEPARAGEALADEELAALVLAPQVATETLLALARTRRPPGGPHVETFSPLYLTNECDPVTLTCGQITDTFRVYNSPTDSFRDHGRQLATLPRYAAAFAYKTNPNQFAAEVHKGGYATDPNYTTKLVNLMTQYNLYQYDLR